MSRQGETLQQAQKRYEMVERETEKWKMWLLVAEERGISLDKVYHLAEEFRNKYLLCDLQEKDFQLKCLAVDKMMRVIHHLEMVVPNFFHHKSAS